MENKVTLIKRYKKYVKGKKTKYMATFRCYCGKVFENQFREINSGRIKSCGCFLRTSHTTHGMDGSRPYRIWSRIKRKCRPELADKFPTYAGKKITYCDRWKSFELFWEDMKEGYSDKLTIDRIDPYGNYCKENCRWATWKQQANNRTNNVWRELGGVVKNHQQWCDEYKINIHTVSYRLAKGWTLSDALKTPLLKKRKTIVKFKL